MSLKLRILLICSAFLVQCKKAELEDNYDPCKGYLPLTGKFYIYQGSTAINGPVPFDTDSVNPEIDVKFLALDNGADYEWRLGIEVIKAKSFSRSFIDVPNQRIPVTLIVKRRPRLYCGDSIGYDSLTRYIQVLPLNTPSKIAGKFRGYINNSSELKELFIDTTGYLRRPFYPSVRFSNFEDTCTDLTSDFKITYNLIQFETGYKWDNNLSDTCGYIIGRGKILANDSVYFYYSNKLKPYKTYVFAGKKIH